MDTDTDLYTEVCTSDPEGFLECVRRLIERERQEELASTNELSSEK